MPTRRRLLASTAVVSTLAFSGCSAAVELATEEQIERTADPAAPDESTLAEHGFETVESDTIEIEEDIEVAGTYREFVGETHIRAYERSADTEAASGQSIAAVISTPGEKAAGQQLSPLANIDGEDLISLLQDELGDEFDGEMSEPEQIDTIELTVLDQPVEVSVFEMTATASDGSEEVAHIHLTVVEHDEDVIVLAGVHPESQQGESEHIHALFEAVRHGPGV